MNRIKINTQRSNVQMAYSFDSFEVNILMDALDFAMACKSFSYEDAKISEDSAFEAVDKLNGGEFAFTRGEVKAIAKTLKFALDSISCDPENFSYWSEDFSDLITNLKNNALLLKYLAAEFHREVLSLKKKK